MMNSVFRRFAVCVCIFVPVLWAWLAAPSYADREQGGWRMPGPLGSTVLRNAAGPGYASLEACIANPRLLAETYAKYGRPAPFVGTGSVRSEIRYMHGLYAMDTIRYALQSQLRTAIRQRDLFTATLASVAAFRNACMKTVWMALRGPADFAVHGLLGSVFLVLAVSLHLVVRRHVQ